MYQKYETRGEQDPIPVYPNYWSVDADGTLPRITKLENDEECGYRPDAQYRWVNMDITKDYYCDECSVMTRWVKSNETICVEDEPGPTPFKVRLTTTGGTVEETPCDGNPVLTYAEGRSYDSFLRSNYQVTLEVGTCVNEVAGGAFWSDLDYNFKKIIIPGNIKVIPGETFSRYVISEGFELGEGVETIESEAFREDFLKNCHFMTFPSTLKEIETDAFDQFTAARPFFTVFLGTTPPIINSILGEAIFVPDESVEAYKNAISTTYYKNRVKPISTKPKYFYSVTISNVNAMPPNCISMTCTWSNVGEEGKYWAIDNSYPKKYIVATNSESVGFDLTCVMKDGYSISFNPSVPLTLTKNSPDISIEATVTEV
jgi:hypothetical protein